jgi:hypothetical protein
MSRQLTAIALVAGLATAAQAQQPTAPVASSFLERYRAVSGLAPAEGQVAEAHHLVLTRETGRLTLERGRLYLLTPVGGRTVGAVFRGEGRFAYTPRTADEQAALRRFADTTALDAPLTEVVLLFADSTAAQLRALSFAAAPIPGDLAGDVHDFVGTLADTHEGSFDGDVMGPFLNGDTTGLFVAWVKRARGDPVRFQFDPEIHEAVQLYRPVSRRRWGGAWALVTENPPATPLPRSAGVWRHRDRLRVPHYRLDVRLTEAVSANLRLAATAVLTLVAEEPVGPWLRFRLHEKLEADSARFGPGDAAPLFKADEDGDLWVRAPRRLARGDSLELTIAYHGDIIDRFADFFFIAPSADWYPANGQGQELATFDATYHSPARYPLVSVGERGDSTIAGGVRTTRWVTREPTTHARFNLGLFERFPVHNEGAPPLEVFWSDDAHRALRRAAAAEGAILVEQRNMRQAVATDISNALALFGSLFGPAPFDHFAVTEIPYGEGVSFPGMIDLSWSTFQNTEEDGFDEMFRAHEVAHQWWGIGVQPGSYRDAWLSEGMAELTGLWYLQAQRRHNTEYYKFLDRYRSDILALRADAGPISAGFRNSTPDVPRGYDVMIYRKGAWVLHMLRAMLLDLGSMRGDRFTALLRDYYRTFRGGVATTEDFQVLAERHVGAPLDWFFAEWVRGTAIPTYHVAWTSVPAEGGRFAVRLRVTQEGVPDDFEMPVIVAVDLGGQRTARFRVRVRGARGEYTSPLLPSEPRDLVFNDLHSVLGSVEMERW